MRLIDADELECFCYKDRDGTFSDGVHFVLERINEIPTIDPEMVASCKSKSEMKRRVMMSQILPKQEPMTDEERALYKKMLREKSEPTGINILESF